MRWIHPSANWASKFIRPHFLKYIMTILNSGYMYLAEFVKGKRDRYWSFLISPSVMPLLLPPSRVFHFQEGYQNHDILVTFVALAGVWKPIKLWDSKIHNSGKEEIWLLNKSAYYPKSSGGRGIKDAQDCTLEIYLDNIFL